MTALVVALAVIVAIQTVLLAGLLRSHGEILRRLHELGAGLDDEPTEYDTALAREFGDPPSTDGDRGTGSAADLAGINGEETLALRVNGVAHDTVLAFLSSGCATCQRFWDEFAGGAPVPADARLVIVTKGPDEESPTEIDRLAPHDVDLIMSSQAWDDYQVPGTPYFVHVEGPSGRVLGEGTGAAWEQVARLLELGADDRRGGNRPARADARRAQDTDRALLEAGIRPGDPSLYQRSDRPHRHGDVEEST